MYCNFLSRNILNVFYTKSVINFMDTLKFDGLSIEYSVIVPQQKQKL